MAFVNVSTNLGAIGMWGKTLAESLDEEVIQAAERIAVRAAELAPKKTGALAASIYVVSWKGNGKARRNARARARTRRADVEFEAPSKPTRRGEAYVVAPVIYAKYQERRVFFLARAKRQEEAMFRARVAARVRGIRL